jgi:hypothetical protein
VERGELGSVEPDNRREELAGRVSQLAGVAGTGDFAAQNER